MNHLFQLCLLLAVLLWGACEWGDNKSKEVFPKDDIEIPFEALGDLVFRWNSTDSIVSGVNQQFRLYRLDSAYVADSVRSFTYSLVMDEPVTTEEEFSLKGRDLSGINGGRHYVWKISQERKEGDCLPIIESQSFVLSAPVQSAGNRALPTNVSLAEPPPPIELKMVCDTIYKFPGCTDGILINCYIKGYPILIAHTVNFADRDFLSNSFGNRTNNTTGCVPSQGDSFPFFFRFFIDVPCDKRSQLSMDEINLYLFSGANEDLVSNITYGVTLNGDASRLLTTPVRITSNDYKQQCAGYCKNSSICKATVEIKGTVPISKNNMNVPYPHYFVFDLSSSSDHASGQVANNIHDSSFVRSQCPQDSLSLAYFQCVDSLRSSAHESEHIVIIPINLCP